MWTFINRETVLYAKYPISSLYIHLLACNQGTYGRDCNKTCGHCLQQTDCHHINGTCLTGCKPGYFGELCKERKFYRHLLCVFVIHKIQFVKDFSFSYYKT